jgi:putative SOS response-associated peptidase YedK
MNYFTCFLKPNFETTVYIIIKRKKIMCGRFVQIIDIELFVKRFGVKKPSEITVQDNFNVAPGDLAYVITNDKPDELQAFQFGLTPHWAKKPMYLINARSEGDFNKKMM